MININKIIVSSKRSISTIICIYIRKLNVRLLKNLVKPAWLVKDACDPQFTVLKPMLLHPTYKNVGVGMLLLYLGSMAKAT